MLAMLLARVPQALLSMEARTWPFRSWAETENPSSLAIVALCWDLFGGEILCRRP
jgi:hypothetical protein